MRSLAWFARHLRWRIGLMVVAVVVALAGGVRLWTSVPPDAVHITITQNTIDQTRYSELHPLTRVIYDRTIQSESVAERLHRDFAGMPMYDVTFDPFAAYLCNHVTSPYNTYTLTWYRAGVPIEQAYTNPSGCRQWLSDGLFVHVGDQDPLNADIAAAITTTG